MAKFLASLTKRRHYGQQHLGSNLRFTGSGSWAEIMNDAKPHVSPTDGSCTDDSRPATSRDHLEQLVAVEIAARTSEDATAQRVRRQAHRGPFQRILDWFYGYDYFISYRWTDGRIYAVTLAEQLKQQGFDCFLDSADYAKGDNWKTIGERWLKKTSRLVLVASPHAVRPVPPRAPGRHPVYWEVELFFATGKRVIPISFDGALTFTDDERPPVTRYLDQDYLGIQEDPCARTGGYLRRRYLTFATDSILLRQSEKRSRILRILIAIFAVLSVTATAAALAALLSYRIAEQRCLVAYYSDSYSPNQSPPERKSSRIAFADAVPGFAQRRITRRRWLVRPIKSTNRPTVITLRDWTPPSGKC